MSRVRIKICGVTRPDDAVTAARLGTDAIGCNFYAGSARAVSAEQAAEIVGALPPFVTTVAVFVNAQAQEVRDVLDRVPVQLLQFHGSEESEFCAGFGLPFIQVINVTADLDWARERERTRGAAAVLLDSHVEGAHGGTGQRFDWSLIPEGIEQRVILAGGLDADNVGSAIEAVRPYAVDVCGGVEASKGIKDAGRMKAFIDAVGATSYE